MDHPSVMRAGFSRLMLLLVPLAVLALLASVVAGWPAWKTVAGIIAIVGLLVAWVGNTVYHRIGVEIAIVIIAGVTAIVIDPTTYSTNPLIVPMVFVLPAIIATRFIRPRSGWVASLIQVAFILVVILLSRISFSMVLLGMIYLVADLAVLTAVLVLGAEAQWTALAIMRKEQAARFESDKRYEDIVERSPAAIMAYGMDGVIIDANQSACRLLGYEAPPELIGMHVLDTIHPDSREYGIERLAHVLSADMPVLGDGHFLRRDGTLVENETIVIPSMHYGQPIVRVIIRDRTDERRAARAVTAAHEALRVAYDATLEGWVRALDLRDKETEGHTQRVTLLTIRFARALNVADELIEQWRRGALLHDIGKLGIPDRILLKSGALTTEEWAIMRLHPVYADQWLRPIDYLTDARTIPAYHHERWDGTGYPRGLISTAIPLAARVFTIIDTFDAITSNRPYAPARTAAEALAIIRSQSGRMFDPELVEQFCLGIESGAFLENHNGI